MQIGLSNDFIHDTDTNGQKKWYDVYTGQPVSASLVNDLAGEDDCGYMFGDSLETWTCDVPFPCLMCKIPMSTQYIIKGLCEDATR